MSGSTTKAQLVSGYGEIESRRHQIWRARSKVSGEPAVMITLAEQQEYDQLDKERHSLLRQLDGMTGSREATELLLEESGLTALEP